MWELRLSDMSGTSHTTTYSYADNPSGGNAAGNSNAYLTLVTDPLGHTEQYSYHYAIGALTGLIDQNRQPTTYKYNIRPQGCSFTDTLNRLGEVDYPDGGKTTYCYNDSAPSPSVTTSQVLNSSTSKTTVSVMDGMGHVTRTQLTTDPSGPDITDMTYDGLGRVYEVWNPYRSTSDSSYGHNTYSYDALGRKTLKSQPDVSTQKWSYTGNTVTYRDETTRVWERTSDALGRLTPGTGAGCYKPSDGGNGL
jgi:hypothetical protein